MHNLIYFTSLVILSCGLYITLVSDNYLRKIFGLGMLQSGVLIFFIALGKVKGGIVPILAESTSTKFYSSPVPHVLMLTAIVVGFASLSLALGLMQKIYQNFGTISKHEIEQIVASEFDDHHS